MVNEVICPNCHKLNDINKFCIHCGHKLLDDEQIRLFLDNPEAYCLNCGRRVEKGQGSCECGYELKDINCPDCNAKNAYANKFCTVCGKKLGTTVQEESASAYCPKCGAAVKSDAVFCKSSGEKL